MVDEATNQRLLKEVLPGMKAVLPLVDEELPVSTNQKHPEMSPCYMKFFLV
jgi:hypothetical protein